MSIQRARPAVTLQKIVSTFKSFEKKLDKLQDDVNYHGHTLSELRLLVANLSNGTVNKLPQDANMEGKRPLKKHTAIQSEQLEDFKPKKKMPNQPSNPSKIKAKSFQNAAKRASNLETPFNNKLTSNSRNLGKHSVRQGKADAPRKATTLRKQKGAENKRRPVQK